MGRVHDLMLVFYKYIFRSCQRMAQCSVITRALVGVASLIPVEGLEWTCTFPRLTLHRSDSSDWAIVAGPRILHEPASFTHAGVQVLHSLSLMKSGLAGTVSLGVLVINYQK